MTKRIAVIDDSSALRLLVAQTLEIAGLETEGFASAEEFLGSHSQRHSHYDMLILDINLPGIDGLSLLRDIRGENKAILILMLTGDATKPTVGKAVSLGANDYLAKPLDPKQLLERVELLLRGS